MNHASPAILAAAGLALVVSLPTHAAEAHNQGRSIVMSREGIVATEQPLASQAGATILAQGGNAMDAIVAANAAVGVVYPSANGIGGDLFAIIYEAKTGKQIYQERLGTGRTGFSASPVASDGKIYFSSEEGDVYVVKAGPTYELLATNPLGEVAMATPAISEGTLLFRTRNHLVAVGER